MKKKVKNKSLDSNQRCASKWLSEKDISIQNNNISDPELIIKNFFDVVNNKKPVKSIGKLKSLSKMIQSVTELEEEGILEKNEAKVLVEFVVQKFIEAKFDKILEGLQINNNYNWFVAASKYSKN